MTAKRSLYTVVCTIIMTGMLLGAVSCSSSGGDDSSGDSGSSGSTIAGASIALDSVLRTIPLSVLTTIRTNDEVAYFHTSHGTHVAYGVFGLPGFKSGDDVKFGVSTSKESGKLLFRDHYGSGSSFSSDDLSVADGDWTTWVDEARTWLELPANAGVTVFMWSWCNIAGHDASAYCASMKTLINEYGNGGTKVGSGRARANPVNFVFMTGHANEGDNTGSGNPKAQAKIIADYCTSNGYYCIDYYSIDTHAMNGTYYEDSGDDGNSVSYGGGFYQDWQDSHMEGVDWYENLSTPAGSVDSGSHVSQHITANRKAFAFWWVLAKLSGWN